MVGVPPAGWSTKNLIAGVASAGKAAEWAKRLSESGALYMSAIMAIAERLTSQPIETRCLRRLLPPCRSTCHRTSHNRQV